MVANESTNEMLKKRLKLLIHKQFFELEKYLGAMYTTTAMDKLIASEKIKAKYKHLEDEAFSTLKGDDLLSKINGLREDQEIEISMLDSSM